MTEPLFLLDTNICLYIIEGLSDQARARMEDQAPGSVVTSAIAYAEVMRGIDQQNADAIAATDRFFAICGVLPFGRDAALAYRAVPFRRGKFDHLIAAHALALGLTLVSNDERDFAEIPGLHVENWTR